MQEGFSSNWTQIAFGFLASFLAGGGFYKLFNTWLHRNKPAADISLTEATAAEVHVRAGSAAGDAVVRFMNRLDTAQVTIDRLRAERDAWEQQYGEVFTERSRLVKENDKLRGELKLYDEEMKTMRATLGLNRLNYDNTQDTPLCPPDEVSDRHE